MERSSVAKFIVVLAIIGGLGAGVVFFGMKYIKGNMGAVSSTAGIEQTVGQKASTGSIQAPDLTSTEVFRCVTAKKPDGIILSPIMFGKATGGYDTVGDQPFGMTSNIRRETSVMSKETLEASKKAVSKFELKPSGNVSIVLPEMPQVLEGSVYYSHTNGIIPLDIIAMWATPTVRDSTRWLPAFTAGGLKESSSEEISNDGKQAKTIKIMNSEDMSVRAEVMVERDIIKKSESISYVAVYLTSPADVLIRQFLDKTNSDLMKSVATKALTTGICKWRQPLAIPEYRKAGSNVAFNVTTVNFSDRYFPGTSAPLIQSSCEMWDSIPIGYSWVMQKDAWEKIKTETIKSLLGKDVPDEELAAGSTSSENIFLKVTKAAESGAGANIVRIDTIDKRTDDKIAVVFDNFGMINVPGLRDGIK